ncbi:MAG: DUF1499 domain-containing protein [Micropepsaceae bacterium]
MRIMSQIQRIDFPTLKRARTPNTFLMAPEGLCEIAKVDVKSPVYAVAAARLRQEFLRVAIAQPRVSHSFSDDAGLYDDFVVRSFLLRFPDLVAVKFLDAKGGNSTLAIYSRSVYGRSDLGVNRARSLGWVRELNRSIEPISS